MQIGDDEVWWSPEVRQAMKQARRGWGSSPEQAHTAGWRLLGAGIFFVVWCWGLGVFLFMNQTGVRFVLVLLILLVAAGLYSLLFCVSEALGLWRYWHTWRRQPLETLVIEGRLTASNRLILLSPCELVRIHQPNGTNKLLMVRARWLKSLADPSPLVRISYVAGTEQVLKVEALVNQLPIESPEPHQG